MTDASKPNGSANAYDCEHQRPLVDREFDKFLQNFIW